METKVLFFFKLVKKISVYNKLNISLILPSLQQLYDPTRASPPTLETTVLKNGWRAREAAAHLTRPNIDTTIHAPIHTYGQFSVNPV